MLEKYYNVRSHWEAEASNNDENIKIVLTDNSVFVGSKKNRVHRNWSREVKRAMSMGVADGMREREEGTEKWGKEIERYTEKERTSEGKSARWGEKWRKREKARVRAREREKYWFRKSKNESPSEP